MQHRGESPLIILDISNITKEYKLKIDYKTIKIDSFTLEVLKGIKDATGRPISRIVKDLVKSEFPNKYKGEK